MGFKDPLTQRRDLARKVRLYPLLDRQLQRAAHKARREYATYLFEMLEWAAVTVSYTHLTLPTIYSV